MSSPVNSLSAFAGRLSPVAPTLPPRTPSLAAHKNCSTSRRRYWLSAFTGTPELTGFTTRPAQVDVTARNTKLAWGARESQRMNFREADRADDIALNEIVWRSVRGADSPMPAPRRAAFFRAHPKSDDDDDDDRR